MEIAQYQNVDNAFALNDQLSTVWAGIGKFTVSQMLPDSSMPSGVAIGTGSANGTTTFQWREDFEWWSPANSYFSFRFRFVKNVGAADSRQTIPIYTAAGDLDPNELVTYCDNFVSVLFNTITTYINNDTVDTVSQPWVVDQVLTYSGAKKNFLDTFGSLCRVGEPLMTRLSNVGTSQFVDVVYRPPCSIYNIPLIPPGASHRIDFTWSGQIAALFESLVGSIPVGTAQDAYNVIIDSFYFHKATCVPNPATPLPSHGVIELNSCRNKQYPVTNTSSYQTNFTLAPTTNRVYVTFQDVNQTPQVPRITALNTDTDTNPYTETTGIKYMGYGTGWTPITSFTKSFSYNQSGVPVLSQLSQLYIQINDLSQILPHPPYRFNNKLDYVRAYMDFASQTQGTKYNDSGSIPLGNAISVSGTDSLSYLTMDISGAEIVAPAIKAFGSAVPPALPSPVAVPTYNPGDSNNRQLMKFISGADTQTGSRNGGVAPGLRQLFFQTSEYGFLGRSPGPIFTFSVCRPPGIKLSSGDINVEFSGSGPSAAIINILCCYTQALACMRNQTGRWEFQLVSAL